MLFQREGNYRIESDLGNRNACLDIFLDADLFTLDSGYPCCTNQVFCGFDKDKSSIVKSQETTEVFIWIWYVDTKRKNSNEETNKQEA